MTSHLPDFLSHYGLCFSIDETQLEYFIYQKKTELDISCSLTVNFKNMEGQIEVMTFYPGLCRHPGTRYLSAVCFFMVMQHCAHFHNIERDCLIHLNTRKAVFDCFYASLKDFNFRILSYGEEDQVDIESQFVPLPVDTSMVIERVILKGVTRKKKRGHQGRQKQPW